MLKRAIPKCTPEQQARQDKARNYGCIACQMNVSMALHTVWNGAEIHHLTKSGRQIGQDQTVCLCGWHHRAICKNYYPSSVMRDLFGPSLAKGSKTFHALYGPNDQLLAYQNELIA